jgi:hypothetical protein
LLMADMIAVHWVLNEWVLLTYDQENIDNTSYTAEDFKIRDLEKFEKNDLNTWNNLLDWYTNVDIL